MKKCKLCNKEILDNQVIKWKKGVIHLNCYTPDKQVDYDVSDRSTDYSGERSPYWDWTQQHRPKEEDGKYQELPSANPDVLSDESPYWNTDEEENLENRKRLLAQFAASFNRLTRRQREVMFALDKYTTQEKAAEFLGIRQEVVSKTLKIVRKKLLQMGIFSQSQGIE